MLKLAAFLFILTGFSNTAFTQLLGSLQQGAYQAGFKIINDRDKDGKPLRICLWYPAKQRGTIMKLSDYVDISSLGGSQDTTALRNDLKKIIELPFVMGLSQISQVDYNKALATPTWAHRNVPIENGRWPLIICDTEPTALLVTNEYLASNGFIVAVPAMQFPPPFNDNSLYEAPTRGLEALLLYMIKESYVDTSRVSALGFGGGTMAAFYAIMRSGKIKSLVNIEGGIFMPESKTTLSADYAPEKFIVPLLHVVNPQIISEESVDQFNAITSRKYRLIEQVHLRHHDFTIYGRIVNELLHFRGKEAELATNVYRELHEHILFFFNNQKPDIKKHETSRFFKLEQF